MRIPRRAAVLLSALALTGAVSACGGDDSTGDTAPGVDEPGVESGSLAPGVGEPEVQPTPSP